MNFFKKDKIITEDVQEVEVDYIGGTKGAPKAPETAPSAVTPKGSTVQINLEKRARTVTICLEKKNVSSLTAEVKLIMDATGSMYSLYRTGAVQEVIERLVPLALQFDDNGEMETYTFAERCTQRKTITKNNLGGYVNRDLKDAIGGGTYYAPAINKIVAEAKAGDLSFPAFVMFITDGDNFDEEETKKALREASKYDIYFQFVGIGEGKFTFLKSLDNLSGRRFDNAGFIKSRDLSRMSDEKLYSEITEEFIDAYKGGKFSTGKIELKK